MEFDSRPFPEPTLAQWREAVERDLKGADFERRLVTRTAEGVGVQPLYTAADAPAPAGAPGQAPYVRGTAETRTWTIRQEYALSGPDRANQAIREDVERGVEGVSIRLDQAFRLGDAVTAHVGTDGLAVATYEDLARALAGVDISRVQLALDAGGNTLAGVAMLTATADHFGVRLADLHATISGDPLGALAADGKLPTPLFSAWDEVAAAVEFAGESAPGVRPWVVSSRAWHRAGANVALDLGLTLASAVEGLRELDARGVPAGVAARHVEFQVELGRDLFMGVAHLRALRLLWFRVLELCGVGSTAAEMRVHAATSARVMTRRDPWVNMLRGTTATFAAIVGGADSIATTPFDAALGRPDRLARRVARNTQLVLRMESHLGAVTDPAGGSWYVETLTDQLAARAWEHMQAIERDGGLGAAIVDGTVGTKVRAAAASIDNSVRHRKDPITGVTNFANPDEVLPHPPAEDLAAIRARRAEVATHGAQLQVGAVGPRGLDAACTAADAGATVEAITAAVSGGRPAVVDPLVPRREAVAFERLVDASDAFAAESGAPPRIFMAAVGPVPKHRARAMWTTHFFHAGGLRVIADTAAESADDAVAAFRASGVDAAVVVTDDEMLPDVLPSLVSQLRGAGARWVAVAGRPPGDVASPDPPDAWVNAGCDVLEVLTQALTALEVLR